MPSCTEDVAVVFSVGGMNVLSITRIPLMNKCLTASSPKLLIVAAVRSVWTTEASDTINVNSRASLTVRLPQLQVERQSEDFFTLCCFNATSKWRREHSRCIEI